MKLTVFLILLSFVQLLANNSYAQKTKLSVDLKNTSIEMVLLNIENQSRFKFIYNKEKVDVESTVSIQLKEKSISETLDALFEGKNVSYTFYGNQVILTNSKSEFTLSQQQKAITGKVTDSSGAPLPGVTVVIKGTTQGTITDGDGNYSLSNVPGDGVLVFSFVGMRSQEIPVTGKTSIDVVMTEEAIGIEEVVAIGYGTVKKKDLTGSVGSIAGNEIINRQTTTLSQAMQGAISGVMVTRDANAPGSTATIRIRGMTTIGENNPLVLIDGIPGSIDAINPNDVESISVLKDAASASIYGSRAAAGVILITTKRAKSNQLSFEYNVESGIDFLCGVIIYAK